MTKEEAQKIIKREGLKWKADSVMSKDHYHFIKCHYNGYKYTVVYNDSIDRIVKLTADDRI